MQASRFYTLSLHDALPISNRYPKPFMSGGLPPSPSPLPVTNLSPTNGGAIRCRRSEERTSELQSIRQLVCRLLLEKKDGDAGLASRTSECMVDCTAGGVDR